MWKWILLSCVAFTATLNAQIEVLAFAGSTQENSVNKKLVIEAAQIARKMGAHVTVIDLKDYDMPLYDADLEREKGMPAQAKRVRQAMVQSQLILIASPEYNGSISGVLKNTIDWASRSEEGGGSREAFKGKKFALMSASPGAGGGAKGLTHLRAIIEHIGGTVLPEQVVVPEAYSAFDADGKLKNPQLNAQLQQLIESGLR